MRRPWIFVLALTLAGCASLPGRSARPARPAARQPAPPPAESDASAGQINQLKRQAAMAQAEIKLLRRQLAALEVEVERLAAVAPVPIPPPVSPEPAARPRFDEIETSDLEPVRIEPRVAEPPRSAPSVVPIEAPVAAPVEEPVAETVDQPGESPVAAPPTSPRALVAPVPLSGQSIYDRGYTLYHQGRFVDAESAFQRFLQAHGDTELADNAQFWIGESRFARDDHMGALLAFQEVLDRYPGGNKVADAMLKVGDCLVQMDKKPAGVLRYEEVVRRFPGSAAAAMAEERLNAPGG